MKTFRCITLVLLFCFISVSNSQNKDTLSFNNYLKGGKIALQFELGSFVRSSYFTSVELAVKPQLSKSSALRLGLSFDVNKESGDVVFGNIINPNNAQYKSNGISVSLAYLHYLNPAGKVCFYFGLGPIYEYYDSRSDETRTGTDNMGYIYTFETNSSSKSWYAGGTGIMGVEWFLVERVSIIGEYNLVFKYGNTYGTNTNKSKDPFSPENIEVRVDNLDVLKFNFNIVKLGLAAYF